MKFIITLTLILSINLASGQADTVFIKYNDNDFEDIVHYKTDTVIFDTPNARQILYGTTVLPWTGNQQNAKGYGIYLANVAMAPCRPDQRLDEKVRVLSILSTDTTMRINLNILGNCCHSFLCDISIVNDSIINLIHYGYGKTYCSCICCFGLSYNLSLLKEYTEFSKLKMVMINDDRRTIRRLK